MNKSVQNNKSNKKIKLAIVSAIVLAICGIVLCFHYFINRTNGEMKHIKVMSWTWSGYNGGGTSEKEESFCDVELHKKCVVKTRKLSTLDEEWEEEVLSFEVTSIESDSVKIHTFQAFSDNKTGINLYADKQDFVIKKNESIELTTPTMDAGDVFELSLSR